MFLKNKMLIVDDNEINREVLVAIFRREFEIEEVESGEDALSIVNDFKPDIVMLDVMMPGIDGYEVCRRMRDDPIHSGIKIVMVTGLALDAERRQGLKVGADEYITKPFGVTKIREIISSMVA